jgi:pyruvate,water dikinase
MRPSDLSTGIASLDGILERLVLGDNVVWLVSAAEQYDYFAARLVEHCVARQFECTYVHFGRRIDYSSLPGARAMEVFEPDLAAGPDALMEELSERIRRGSPGAHYLFDNLSLLCQEWGGDDSLVEFFQRTCPLLFEMEAVAYFALLKGEQSNRAVAKIRDTTQILLDVYEEDGLVFLQPIKVWDRYSETMFHAHVLSGEQFVPAESPRPPGERPVGPRVELLAQYEQRGGDERSPAIREELIRTVVSDRPEYIRIGREHFAVQDIVQVRSRTIGSGTIGGKAAGMLLSSRILRNSCQEGGREGLLRRLRHPESYFLGSDAYFNFLINNNLLHWLDLRHREPDEMAAVFGDLQAEFQAGEFPRAIREGLRKVVEEFKGEPLIVRSSSLLEDSVDMAFAGKYESVFLGNQGKPSRCVDRLLSAVKRVYASSLGPDALAYRRRHNLLEFQEHMAVLIQKVEGTAYNGLFFPAIAGVAFSRNPYPWSERIDTGAGLVRLVFGLGTRAVNRVDADYPRLVALSHPGIHPDGEYMSSTRYHQKHMDAVSFESNELETVAIADHVRGDYPGAFHVFSLFEDGVVRAPVSSGLPLGADGLTVTFQNLLKQTDFVEMMRYVLDTVEQSYGYPVDIEFTLDVGEDNEVELCLLQCRPLTQRTEFQPAVLPVGLPSDRMVFTTSRAVPNGHLRNVRYIALVDSRSYDAVPDVGTRSRLARAIGAVNRHAGVAGDGFALIGPGRWGSVNIELGVQVTYGEINNARLLMEMARPKDGYTPEVSYGTHFFQDLVESGTFYLPVYPEEAGAVYNERFFDEAPNRLGELLPEYADVAAYLKLIDVPASSDGQYLHVAMSQPESVAIGYLGPRLEDT